MFTNTNNDPFTALRDIHLPDPISVWPLAIGWYLLAAMIICLSAMVILHCYRYWRKNRVRRIALLQLAALRQQYQTHGHSQVIISELSQLLRRVALCYYPRRHVAGLKGKQWLEFLARSGDFNVSAGRLLCLGPYQSQLNSDITILLEQSQHWLNHLKV